MLAGPTAVTLEVSYRFQFALLSERIVTLSWTTSTINQIRGGLSSKSSPNRQLYNPFLLLGQTPLTPLQFDVC